MDWLRRWRRDGALAAVIAVTLALGIGVNLTIFSALEAVVLASLPVPHPRQIYLAHNGTAANPDPRFAYPVFQQLQHAWAGQAQLAAFTSTAPMYAPVAGVPPRRLGVQLVSGGYFAALGVRPWRGRFFGAAADRAPDGAPVAVVSYRYWRRHPAMEVGQALTVNGVALSIVGVAAPHFYGLAKANPPDLWVPLRLQARLHYNFNADTDSDRGPYQQNAPWATELSVRWLHVLARVSRRGAIRGLSASGTAVDQLSLAPYRHHVSAYKQAKFRQERVWLAPAAAGLAYLSQRLSQPLWILLGMAGLVLLIACANIAMLLTTRALGRQQETAVRLAVGAMRWRLAAEDAGACVGLAAVGAGLGLAIAALGRGPLLKLLAGGAAAQLPWNGQMFVAAAVAAVGTGLLAGVLPALRGSRSDGSSGLGGKSAARGSGRGKALWGRVLVAAQVALSLVLLLGAAWLARSLQTVLATSSGMSMRRVVALPIYPRMAGVARKDLPNLVHRLVSRLGVLPGAESAAVSQCGVMMGCSHGSSVAIGPSSNEPVHGEVQEDFVTPAFFRVLGIQVIRGRGILPRDGPHAPQVVVVNQAFVRRYLPGRNPIGAVVNDYSPVRIVGVVNDVRANGLAERAPPMIYHAWAQHPVYPRFLAVRAATAAAAPALTQAIRRSLAAISPDMPIGTAATLEVHASHVLGGQRAIAELSGGFAILALLLAGLGLYGVMAFAVARRTNEIGVRMALGARPAWVLGMVLRDAARVVAPGLVVGAALAVPAVGLLRSQMFGLSPLDPTALAGAVVALLAVALAAAFWPARRAAHIEPWLALLRD